MAAPREKMISWFKSHNKIKEYSAAQEKVHSVAWNCDGRRLACGSMDKTVTVFMLDSHRLVKDHTFRGHGGSVDQLCWHPRHSDQVISASSDKTIRLWDARISKAVSTISTKGENLNLCWSPDGHTIAVGNKDDLVSFIDVRTHKTKHDEQFKFEVNEISWNNSGDLFFLTSGPGAFHVYSSPDIKAQHVQAAHPSSLICIKFDPTSRYFAIGSADALVSIWDCNEFVCLRTLSRLDWQIRTLSFSHDGSMLASGSEDLLIDIADVETGEKITDVPCESPTFSVAWHPKKNLLAYACDDKEKYERDRDSGTIKLFGIPSDGH